jgi:hypothetical protein
LFIGGPADGDVIPVRREADVWNVPEQKPQPIPNWGDVLKSLRGDQELPLTDSIQIHRYRQELIQVGRTTFFVFVHEGLTLYQAIRQLLVRYSGGRLDD